MVFGFKVISLQIYHKSSSVARYGLNVGILVIWWVCWHPYVAFIVHDSTLCGFLQLPFLPLPATKHPFLLLLIERNWSGTMQPSSTILMTRLLLCLFASFLLCFTLSYTIWIHLCNLSYFNAWLHTDVQFSFYQLFIVPSWKPIARSIYSSILHYASLPHLAKKLLSASSWLGSRRAFSDFHRHLSLTPITSSANVIPRFSSISTCIFFSWQFSAAFFSDQFRLAFCRLFFYGFSLSLVPPKTTKDFHFSLWTP